MLEVHDKYLCALSTSDSSMNAHRAIATPFHSYRSLYEDKVLEHQMMSVLDVCDAVMNVRAAHCHVRIHCDTLMISASAVIRDTILQVSLTSD